MSCDRAPVIIILLFLLTGVAMYGQTTEITGRVIANGDVENIHVINRTSNYFTFRFRIVDIRVEFSGENLSDDNFIQNI